MNWFYKYKEDFKGLGVVLGLALFFIVIGYQCRKRDYVKIQKNCIEEYKPLIGQCNNALFQCKFFNYDGCLKAHKDCIEPYVRCLEK